MASNSKKGVVSLTIFSLSVLVMILIVFFTYFYQDINKKRALEDVNREVVLNSISSFRSEMLLLTVNDNLSTNYTNILDSNSVILQLSGNRIIGIYDYQTDIVTLNLTTLGVQFCGDYYFSPYQGAVFSFNGSCISKS